MRLAIMQPYFFPHLAYFQLMSAVDEWIVFEDVQFIDKGWINRNRILHPNSEKQWQYFTLPITGRKQFSKINELSIHPEKNWEKEILGKLSHLKKTAPYYEDTIHFLEDCFSEKCDHLATYLTLVLEKTAKKLGIHTPIKQQSALTLGVLNVSHAGQWALAISKAYGACEYVNPVGGRPLFDNSEFKAENIRLRFLKGHPIHYAQRQQPFVPGLSVIDVFMWNSPEKVQEFIQQYEIVEPND